MLTGGSLPDGLTLSIEGVISGTPANAGAFTFTVRAEGFYRSAEKAFTILVPFTEKRAPNITTDSLPSWFIGSPYGFQLKASGTTPLTWALVNGSLPKGLSITGSGYIYGTPEVSCDAAQFTVQAKNDTGSATADLTSGYRVPLPPSSLETRVEKPARYDKPFPR